MEVFRGGVWCYASDTNRNPSSVDYVWRLYITEYNDSFIDPMSLGGTAGTFLFIAIEGIDTSNDFKLNSTSGDTSIAGSIQYHSDDIMCLLYISPFATDINIGTVFGDTISNGVIKFYSLPFSAGGLTFNLTVSSGYISCYISDRFRNPNQYMFDQFIIVRDYYEVYLDPQTLSGTQGRYLYVSFLGGNSVNVYQAQSFLGDALTVGECAINHFILLMQEK